MPRHHGGKEFETDRPLAGGHFNGVDLFDQVQFLLGFFNVGFYIGASQGTLPSD